MLVVLGLRFFLMVHSKTIFLPVEEGWPEGDGSQAGNDMPITDFVR